MRVMSVSDIHGSAHYYRGMLDIYEGTEAKRLVLPGDILYHGSRNDPPRDYAPKEVIAMLNPMKGEIYAVRRNCDIEVDQMVLDFLIMADYGLFVIKDRASYTIHGHVLDQDHLPPMKEGDILVHGHTHPPKAEIVDNISCGRIITLNPGSVPIPKGGNPHTYTMLVDGVFRTFTLDRDLVKKVKL